MRHLVPWVRGSVVLLFSGVVLGSCGTPPSASETATIVFLGSETQIAHGADVYRRHCAKCHGDSGQGSDRAPALVGAGALADYATALEVAAFVTESMPPSEEAKQVLRGFDHWAVLAFALSANGIELSSVVSAGVAKTIRLRR